MFKLVLFIALIFSSYSYCSSASLSWSIKAAINNIKKIDYSKTLKSRRENAFFQTQSEFLDNSSDTIDSDIHLTSSATRPSDSIDDIVLYDYTQDQKQVKKPVIKEAPTIINLNKVSEKQKIQDKNFVYDYSISDEQACFEKKEQKISHVSTNKISAESISFSDNSEDIVNFEISFLDDRDEIIASDFEGNAIIGEETILARQASARQVILYAPGHYPLSVKVDMSQEESDFRYPIFEKNSLESFLENEGIPSYEGLLLLGVDEQTRNLYIDKPYKKKFFLSEDFQITNEENASYLFYAGVELGNLEIIFENKNETVYKSIVHMRAEEIQFVHYEKEEATVSEVRVCQRELLGSRKSRVSVSGKQIELFNNETFGEKLSINKYRFPKYGNLFYQKDYLIFKHLSEDIMLSTNGTNYVEIPSQSYLDYLVKEFDLNEVHCMVQLNFSSPIKSFISEGYTSLGFMPMEISVLDKNGLFDTIANEETQKAYLYAQGEGVIYSKVTYANETVDYIESFCGPGSYSIEQL